MGTPKPPKDDVRRLKEPAALPNRVVEVDRILSMASEAGLTAAVVRLDLSPGELGVLGLLTDFRDAVPGAERAAQALAERSRPERRKRYTVAGVKPGAKR